MPTRLVRRIWVVTLVLAGDEPILIYIDPQILEGPLQAVDLCSLNRGESRAVNLKVGVEGALILAPGYGVPSAAQLDRLREALEFN
jgi:hypothetical protein